MRWILILFLSPLFADAPKPAPFVFITPKAACSLLDGKLVLARAWPFGSWEDCSYAVLSAAQQLDAQKDALAKQLSDEQAKPPNCPTKK